MVWLNQITLHLSYSFNTRNNEKGKEGEEDEKEGKSARVQIPPCKESSVTAFTVVDLITIQKGLRLKKKSSDIVSNIVVGCTVNTQIVIVFPHINNE